VTEAPAAHSTAAKAFGPILPAANGTSTTFREEAKISRYRQRESRLR